MNGKSVMGWAECVEGVMCLSEKTFLVLGITRGFPCIPIPFYLCPLTLFPPFLESQISAFPVSCCPSF